MDQHSTLNYWLSNGVSTGAIVGAIIGFIPAIAALVALLWYVVQIYESKTVQTWVYERRIRKLAHYKAAAIMLEAQLKHPETPVNLDHPQHPPEH